MSGVDSAGAAVLVADEAAVTLAEASSALLHCADSADVYRIIGEFINGLIPRSAVIINEATSDARWLTVRHVIGLEDGQLAQMAGIFGINAPGSRWRTDPDVQAHTVSGLLSRVPGGMAQLAFTEAPSAVAEAVAQILGSYDVFTLGIADGSRALAAVHIIVRTPAAVLPNRIIESFAGHCFSTLSGLHAVGDLNSVSQADALIFRNMADGFAVHEIVLDSDGHPGDYRYLSVNPAFESIAGLDSDEIIGHTVFELFPGMKAAWRARYETVAITGAPTTFEDYSGVLDRHLHVSAFSPRPGQLATLITDITARKQAEEALLAREEEHMAVVQTAMDGFWTADLAGHLLAVNEAYAEMSGYSEQELLSMNICDLEAALTPKETAASLKMIASRGGDRFESRHRRKDGSVFDVEVSVQDRLTESGRQTAFVRDISQRKRSEALIERHQARLRSLAAELRVSAETERRRVCVELHDGIGQVLASAKIAAQSIAAEEPEAAVAEQADRLVRLLGEAIHEVRAITSGVALPVLFDLGLESALLWLRDRYAQLYDLRCTVEVDRDIADLRGESAMFLFRVVREGLNNVVLHSGSLAGVVVRAEQTSDQWGTVSISDEGCGFDPELIDEPGVAGSFGLFSIREECIDRGGSLHVWARPGEGTRIAVRIPECVNRAVAQGAESRAESLAARQDIPYAASYPPDALAEFAPPIL